MYLCFYAAENAANKWFWIPKFDSVHLDVTFWAGKTFRHSSKWLIQSQPTAGFPTLSTIHLHNDRNEPTKWTMGCDVGSLIYKLSRLLINNHWFKLFWRNISNVFLIWRGMQTHTLGNYKSKVQFTYLKHTNVRGTLWNTFYILLYNWISFCGHLLTAESCVGRRRSIVTEKEQNYPNIWGRNPNYITALNT